MRCEELQLELASAIRRTGGRVGTGGTGVGGVGSGGGVSVMSSSVGVSGGQSWQPPGTEIERIMAKIEQDNRILAELEHSRSTTHGKFRACKSNNPLYSYY